MDQGIAEHPEPEKHRRDVHEEHSRACGGTDVDQGVAAP
jgi:hypothetical protein